MKLFPLLSGFALLAYSGYAQESPQIIPPSPNAASLGKYAEIPVSYYSGLPTVSIPLYEIEEKDISVPIALSYHASGIKVDQEASWVGLGWDLQAGGVISRTVMNHDDFDPAYNYFDNTVPLFISPDNAPKEFYQEGCNPEMVNTATGQFKQADLSKYITSTANDPYEFEPDQYSFNFLGYTGKFVLDRDRNAILAQQQKIKIKCSPSGNDWTITTDDGYRYEFKAYESYTDDNISRPIHTAWYLTAIVSPTGGRVDLFYDQDGTISRPNGGIYEENIQSRIFVGSGTPGSPSEGKACQRAPVRKLLPRKNYQNLTLSRIDFPNGQVRFDYNGDRIDLQGGKRLLAISIFEKGGGGKVSKNPYRQYKFSYDYFVGFADDDIRYEPSDYTTKRLKLLSVQETASTQSKPPHRFTYYEGSTTTNLPSKCSFARDHWGYFNGAFNNTTLIPEFKGDIFLDFVGGQYVELSGADRKTNPTYAKAFSLKQIEYPTQGTSTFEYQSHDFDLTKSSRNPVPRRDLVIDNGAVRFLHDKANATITRTLNLSNAVPRTDGTVKVRLSAAFRLSNPYNPQSPPIGTIGSRKAYFELYNSGGKRISVVDLTDARCEGSICEYTNDYILRPEEYIWRPFITEAAVGVENIAVAYFYDKYVEPSDDDKSLPKAGGLRISKITDRNQEDPNSDLVRTFQYNYKEDRDQDGEKELYSYGRRMAYPIYERYEKNDGVFSNGDHYECIHFVRSANSSVPLNGTAGGSVVGYDQVSVVRGPDGTLGKSTYQYENRSNIVYFYDNRRLPGLSNLISNKNGMLKEYTEYAYREQSYRRVKQVVNDYRLKKKAVVYGVRDQDLNYLTALGECAVGLFFYPSLQSDWVQLNYTIERRYDENNRDLLVETRTDYAYEDEPKHYQVVQRTTEDSKKRSQTVSYQYPLDFTNDKFGSAGLRERHMHQVALREEKQVNGNLVEASERSFITKSNETTVPRWTRTYPSGDDTFIQVNYLYDEEGNLVQEKKKHDRPVSYVWGYRP